MEQLKSMKEQLTSLVQGQLAHTDCVDTKELGEAVDMIKDLAEAIYYCSITDAMEESTKEPKGGNTYYYTIPREDYGMAMPQNRMYYGGNGSGNSGSGSNSRMYGGRVNPVYYTPNMYMPEYREYEYMPQDMMPHDPREGRAKQSRRMYMESKEMHKDAGVQMRDLENYIKDLSDDITEMIEKATPEEKQILKQKIATLSTKIV